MTVVRVRPNPGGTDIYGDPVDSTASRETIDGAYVAPRTSSEVDERGRTGVIVGLTLFVPYGTDLIHTDEVEVDGTLYRVDGEVGHWKNPLTEWEAGSTVALVRAAG